MPSCGAERLGGSEGQSLPCLLSSCVLRLPPCCSSLLIPASQAEGQHLRVRRVQFIKGCSASTTVGPHLERCEEAPLCPLLRSVLPAPPPPSPHRSCERVIFCARNFAAQEVLAQKPRPQRCLVSLAPCLYVLDLPHTVASLGVYIMQNWKLAWGQPTPAKSLSPTLVLVAQSPIMSLADVKVLRNCLGHGTVSSPRGKHRQGTDKSQKNANVVSHVLKQETTR